MDAQGFPSTMTQRQLRKVCNIEAIASIENLFVAAENARRGKSRRPDVEDWWMRRESEIVVLREELLSGSYRPAGYRTFIIHEPKRREISAAPFRDRVVHHALCNLLAPVLERRFIARSFSCQKGKGTTAARECCRVLTNRFPYVLKCDVSKFFAQIDHRILLDKLGAWVTCPHAMGLIARVVASHHTGDDPPPAFFPGDDWVLATLRPRGLPIGNLTSQLWANFYLDDLDHEITDEEGHGTYLRYTDDFLLFDDDKGQLWALAAMIEAHLAGLRLRLARPKSRLLATHEGVPFCGFRFLPGLQPRVLGATKRRFERRRHWMFRTRMPAREMAVRIFSWYQFSREANSTGLRRAYCGWPLDGRERKRRCRRTRVAGASRRFLEQQQSCESAVVVSQQQ
jgi:hypothetical protein